MKRYKTYIILLSVLFGILMLLQLSAPQPVDWTASFTKSDKIPYGAYILFDLLPRVIASDIQVADLPVYNTLNGSEVRTTYLFINSEFSTDKLDTRELLDFVDGGNTAFIAAESFDGELADSLKLSVSHPFAQFTDSVSLNFVNPALKAEKDYTFKRTTVATYFSTFDTASVTVLGMNSNGDFNFIRQQYGEGFFYLSTAPRAFTNYNLLNASSSGYAFKALSYLPKQRLIWDEYYKAGRQMVETPMRYVLSQAPLRWAFYLLIAGIIIFIIFVGKRRQRIIPIAKPLTNTTLDFVETVGRLYYQHGDHRNIAGKKINYFLEYLRSTFGVATSERGEEFYRMLSGRSGVDPEQVRQLFVTLDVTMVRDEPSEEELGRLNSAIENFHNTVTR